MKDAEKFEMINDMLRQVRDRENDFPIIDEKGAILFPVCDQRTGIRTGWTERMGKVYRFAKGGERTLETFPLGTRGYNGNILEVNERGNVTVYRCYKNGKRKEIASMV